MTSRFRDQTAPTFGDRASFELGATPTSVQFAPPKVSLRAKCWWCWHNLCRLFLIKVWFQLALGFGVLAWWLSKRDTPATATTVVIILVLSSWMMSRERIRRNLAGEKHSGLAGRMDDNWSTFDRPFLCLDEINHKRKAQEKKDRISCRIGILFTVLAGAVAVLGFQS